MAPSSFRDEEGFYCLQGELLWKYRAIDAEYQNGRLAVQAKQVAIDEEIRKHETLRALLAEKASMIVDLQQKATELQAVNADIEARLQVSLKNCAIDDHTGRIYVLGQDGSRAPMTGVQKRSKTHAKKAGG